MNADFLLSALSRFGDHPDRIQEFRKVIIGLAIAGRLQGDNTARAPAELMEAIERRKEELFAQREIAKPKRHPAIIEEQLPEQFVDPSFFAPLGAIARIEKGLTGIQQAQPGAYPLVVTAAERSSCDHFDFEGAAAIIPLVSSTGHGHASINRLHYQDGQFALGTILAAVMPFAPELISARFLYEYLSTFKEELLVTRMTGTANVTLSIGRIAEVPIPLVCPTVQRKVDELMALCDQLEAAQAERETQRGKLTLSTLTKLNEPDPKTFADDARFALEHFENLTSRTDQIKQLRQTILNLAVRGKLVEQDPNRSSALELLSAIKSLPWEKKRNDRVFELDQDAIAAAFPLPIGWVWASVDALVRQNQTVTYGILKPEWVPNGIPTVRVTEMKTGQIDLSKLPRCAPERAAKFSKTTLQTGDLLISKDGTIGKTAFVPPELAGGNITQHVLRFPIVDLVNTRYIRIVIDSPFCQFWMAGETKGVALQGVNVGDFRRMPIPLPSLAEQHRIVANVDELMALCDQLEASLVDGEQSRSKLLGAVLHEALEPVSITSSRELEVAECLN